MRESEDIVSPPVSSISSPRGPRYSLGDIRSPARGGSRYNLSRTPPQLPSPAVLFTPARRSRYSIGREGYPILHSEESRSNSEEESENLGGEEPVGETRNLEVPREDYPILHSEESRSNSEEESENLGGGEPVGETRNLEVPREESRNSEVDSEESTVVNWNGDERRLVQSDAPSEGEEEGQVVGENRDNVLGNIPLLAAEENLNNIPIPIIAMANPLAQQAPLDLGFQVVRPVRFSGEVNTVGVVDFLDVLETLFPYIERQYEAARWGRMKALTIQGYLEGPALQFWLSLPAATKATYDAAAGALRQRFSDELDDDEEFSNEEQAVIDMNNLTQGAMGSKEYADKAKNLYTVLGNDYSRVLANKFVDGIKEPTMRALVDAQIDGRGLFPEVLKAFRRCTKSIRRSEAMNQPKAVLKKEDDKENRTDSAMEKMVFQVGELIKELNMSKKAERVARDSSGYQPIVGTIGVGQPQQPPAAGWPTQQPAQGPPYQPAQGPPYQVSPYPGPGPGPSNYPRPRGGLICYTCGELGHRTYECRATTVLSREEQDKLRASRSRYPGYSYYPGGPPPPVPAPVLSSNTSPMVPQPVAYVEVTDEELGLDQETDPAGTMMIATQSVDIIEESTQVKSEQMRSYISGLTDEERSCLSLCLVALAEKRARNENENELAEVAPQTQRQKVGQQTIPGTGSFQIQPPPAPISASRVQVPASASAQQMPTQATVPRATTAPRVAAPPTLPHEGAPFIPDPRFEDPTTWSTFVPSAAVPKNRGRRQQKKEPKAKKHIKMMKGKLEWDPVEALRNTPVVGLDFGNLLDMSPSTRVLVGKALQYSKEAAQNSVMTVGYGGEELGIINAVQEGNAQRRYARGDGEKIEAPYRVVNTHEGKEKREGVMDGVLQECTTQGWREKVEGAVDGVLQEPTHHIINFHTGGTVWSSGLGKGIAYRIGKILIDGGAVVNLMPERTARSLGLQLA